MAVTIQGVDPHSPAQRAGIQPGDRLVAISGHPIQDLLDYRFYMTERSLTLQVERDGQALPPIPVKKGQYDDLGLRFETYLMDKHHSCKNKCVFCFIDQLPRGLRSSLYFKDDDDRLSFLFGNYITMTNLREEDVDRIIRMHISPINISVHTTDPQLRVKMMKNPAAATSLGWLRKLADGGIRLNTQLVLCPGINDGEALRRTLEDLLALGENLQSIAAVPVGLSDHRQGLEPLRPFTPEEAGAVIDLLEEYGSKAKETYGCRKAFPADEFYLKAGRPIPPAEFYEDFDQLEDGVGLMANLRQQMEEAMEDWPDAIPPRTVTVVTGVAAAGFLEDLARQACARTRGLTVQVIPVVNELFGRMITVAGLVTGGDIIRQLKDRPLGEEILIPACMLRHEQDCFLDDTTPEQVGQRLGRPVTVVEVDGWELADRLLGQDNAQL